MKSVALVDALGRPAVHPFPARMAPCIALDALKLLSPRSTVLDPMSGSGTVAALARSQGHRAIAFDIDPLAVLIGKVWVKPLPISSYLETASAVLRNAKRRYSYLSDVDAMPEGADSETKAFCRYWFNLDVRRQLLSLSRSIATQDEGPLKDALWCAYSRMIIAKQAGVSRALDLSHSRPHRAFKFAPRRPFDLFLSAADRVAKGCVTKEARIKGPASSVSIGDARRLPVPSGCVDLVFTSPPYLNAIDYLRCSKFSLVWMGHAISTLRQIRSVSIGAEVGARASLESLAILEKLKLEPVLSDRLRSILSRYTQDTISMLTEARRVLSKKGRVIVVIGENTIRGTFIPTGKLVEFAGELAGLEVISRHVRTLPNNRRYLPPPGVSASVLDNRMRREVILELS